jgi:hypothetical protein
MAIASAEFAMLVSAPVVAALIDMHATEWRRNAVHDYRQSIRMHNMIARLILLRLAGRGRSDGQDGQEQNDDDGLHWCILIAKGNQSTISKL